MASDPTTGTSTGTVDGRRMQVLVVCTANRCRSPIAAALLGKYLPGGAGIDIRSAGLLAGGHGAEAPAVTAMAKHGLDLSAHVSHRIDAADIDGASLIVTMTRQQVREIVAARPSAWRRCFPLKDFVRRGEQALRAGDGLDELLDRIDAERGPETVMGSARADDVADPMGRSRAVWRAVTGELEEQTTRLADLLVRLRADAPPATGPPAPPR